MQIGVRGTARRRGFASFLISGLSLAAGLMVGGAPAQASPWTRGAGHVFVETRSDYFAVDPTPAFAFERLETNLYTEIGVLDHTMVGFKAGYGNSWVRDGASSFEASGLTEFEGFAQQTLWWNDKSILSAKIAAASPRRISVGDREGLVNEGIDLEGRLLFGHDISARPVKLFTAAEIAYRKRFDAAADEIRIDGLIGIEPVARWLLLAEALTSFSARNNQPDGADFDVVRLKPSLVFQATERFAIRAGASFEVHTRNLAPGTTYFVGVWTQF